MPLRRLRILTWLEKRSSDSPLFRRSQQSVAAQTRPANRRTTPRNQCLQQYLWNVLAIKVLQPFSSEGAHDTDRRELAQKVLYAQLHLARLGFSTGGTPPYGFRRWLAKEDGTAVRELVKGERVRMAGHHVVWLPGPDEEWVVIRRILQMLETTSASRVARLLTEEGVPAPGHGRYRTDNGVRHQTSGVWYQSTLVNIASNPLLLAVVEYGRRSIGDQLRYTLDGPRELGDGDFQDDTNKPKVVRNPEENRVTVSAWFKPRVDPDCHRRLIATLDKRAGTQRGKPRSRKPKENPLGCRIFDMNCGWPLYRKSQKRGFLYVCGLYQQTHGEQCRHNSVDGPTAARFMLSCVRQHALSPHRLQKLEDRIRQLAVADQGDDRAEQELARKRASLLEVVADRDQASKNLARAATDEQYDAVAEVFEELGRKAKSIEKEIATAEQRLAPVADTESSINMAMEIVSRLTELAASGEDLGDAKQVFDMLNARLFLKFSPVKVKKRTVNKIRGGVVTFGDAEPPIEIYEGPTGRSKIKGPATSGAAGPGESSVPSPRGSSVNSGREDKSLGNVGRGERRPTRGALLVFRHRLDCSS